MRALVFVLSLFVVVACSNTDTNTDKFGLKPETIRYSRFLSNYLDSHIDSVVKTKYLVKNNVFVYSNSDRSTVFEHVQKANMKYFKMYITKRSAKRLRAKTPYHFPQVTYLPMSKLLEPL